MITKYDKIQSDIFVYIWNRMTALPAIEEVVLACEITERFPTWIAFADVPPAMQTEVATWLIRQARFYRTGIVSKLASGTTAGSVLAPTLTDPNIP